MNGIACIFSIGKLLKKLQRVDVSFELETIFLLKLGIKKNHPKPVNPKMTQQT